MADEKTENSTTASQKAGPKPIVFILLAVVNMLVVVTVAVMLFLNNKKKAQEATIDDVIKGEGQTQKKEFEKKEEFIGQLIPLETFLVNLAGTRGTKLAKVNMEFEVEGEQVMAEIEKRKPQIRDIIISLLSSKTYAEVSTKEGKDFLRNEFRDTVNSFLSKGRIKRVYFTEFILN